MNSITKKCVQSILVQKSNTLWLLNSNVRAFGRRGVKYPKGSFGKEDSIAFNSGFPKHKELFAEDYYSGEPSD